MTASAGYQWRRDKDGLGVWEHRGKVAVAGVGHSPVDRRRDEVAWTRRSAPTRSWLPRGDGRRWRDAGPDRRRHLLRQPYCRRQRRLRIAVGARPYFAPALSVG